MKQDLQNKKIVLGVTGGIAAYKACSLCRLLIKKGADVHVIMTKAATNLVSKKTLEILSHHEVLVEFFEDISDILHIEVTKDADLFVIAPATANTIAKVAHGFADNALTASILASHCPIVFAPAMNTRMYKNLATQENIHTLVNRGYFVIAPDSGSLACGEEGEGRMREPEDIVAYIVSLLHRFEITYKETSFLEAPLKPLSLTETKLLPRSNGANLKVLITAGPTIEPIDPVRYISNKSSGKMGYALAAAAQKRGAYVTIISGPVEENAKDGIAVIDVKTAKEMYSDVMKKAQDYDIVIGCAAVSDYSVENVSLSKIKKDDNDELVLKLVKNKDIIKEVASLEEKRPFVVGFAAETNNCETNAIEKITRKNLDLIVLNDVSNTSIGFNSNDNEVTIFDKDGKIAKFDKASKDIIADKIMDLVFDNYHKVRQ